VKKLRGEVTYTTLDFGAGIFTFAGAENPQGDVAGVYYDAGFSAGHSFLLSDEAALTNPR
jgi:hypothetical protein